jgi:hypothetical protein
MNIEILENGNLKLSLESDDDIEKLKSDYGKYYNWAIADFLEPYSCNGGYVFFEAGDGNPFVGLTDAPCIAEQLDYLDDGTIEIIGNFWYYDDYMIKSFIEELLEDGKVIFTLAKD